MGYPTYVGSGTIDVKTAGASVRAYYPAGSVDDIVIGAAYNGYAGNFSTPSGWTMIRDTNGWAVAWKRMTSTSASSVAFEAASSTGFMMGVGHRFGSCNKSVSPTDGSRNNSGSSSWYVVTGGTVVSSKDDSLFVWCGGVDDNVIAANDATYFTERDDQNTALGTTGMMAMYTYAKATAGSVPSDSYGITALSNYVSTVFAIKPIIFYSHSVLSITAVTTDEIIGLENDFIDEVVGV